MSRYLIDRAAHSLLLMAVMSFAIYGLMGLMPGDPIDLMISADPNMTSHDAARMRALYGLDLPIIDRYLNWLKAAAVGDFGFSRLHAKPVMVVLIPALLNSLALVGASFLLAIAIGIPAGIFAASRARSKTDYAINLIAFAGISIPPFWLGLILIIIFSVIFGILPAGGIGFVTQSDPSLANLGAELVDKGRYLVLPVASLTIASIGGYTRFMRAAMMETLGQDFIRTAHAKGLPEGRVILAHALPNAMIPVITIIALNFGYLFSGALITETIFAYPGMGKLIFDAIMGNDFNLALIALLLATLLTLIGNFIADIAYVWLDPRISFDKSHL